ncbi:MAG TPA: hypothetical protein DEP51_06210 [Clostridiales bacterium]|nr:hypothetical protein [Clostridiales bacterium]
MNKRKVVTLCGSVRFWDKIQEVYEKLELENKYAVIGITPHVMNRDFTEDEEAILDELHKIKIDLSDAIYVINVNGYIGKSTREEIEYAKKKGKEIMYLENEEEF